MFFYITYLSTQVSCPPDYRSWLETMYVLFGTKWLKIYSGPTWSHVSAEQIDVASVHTNYDPAKVCFEILYTFLLVKVYLLMFLHCLNALFVERLLQVILVQGLKYRFA